MHDLMEAKKTLQEFGKRADLDAIAKTKLTVIANALGEAEQRLKALEEVVEELAAGANLKTVRGTMPNSHYVAKLLGKHRGLISVAALVQLIQSLEIVEWLTL